MGSLEEDYSLQNFFYNFLKSNDVLHELITISSLRFYAQINCPLLYVKRFIFNPNSIGGGGTSHHTTQNF